MATECSSSQKRVCLEMATECSSSQKRVCLVSLDRLSSLPIELINIILTRIPIRDAVRTSALSRFWRYCWMQIPDLVFDARSIPPLLEGQTSAKPVDLVNRVLFLHNENISRFEISNYLNFCCPDIDRWIYLLARKQVKKLILEFPSGERYKLSSSLFFCQDLRVLKLCRSILSLPSITKCFGNLVDLHFTEVTFSNETIASLIFNNPLRRLVLYCCDGFTRLNIYASKLRAFYIHGSCETIKFGNTPKLEYAYMGLLPLVGPVLVPIHNGRRFRLEDVLGGLINAQKFYIRKQFLKILVECVPQARLRVSFSRLSYISLEMNLESLKEISTVLCLFRSAPYVQAMDLKSWSNEKLMHLNEGKSSEALLRREKTIFLRLGTVGLTGFRGAQNEMRFVELILLNALVLQTMSIKWEVGNVPDDQRKARLLEEMMKFERASPKAKVIFLSS